MVGLAREEITHVAGVYYQTQAPYSLSWKPAFSRYQSEDETSEKRNSRNSRYRRERETSGWGPVVNVTQETYISATSSALEVTAYGLQATYSWHWTATRFICLYVNDVVRLQPKLAWVDKLIWEKKKKKKKTPLIITKFRPVGAFLSHVGEAEEQSQRS